MTQRADVQLEHGYVRIANRLVEAILDADFTGAQVRILLALVRLTYGWRQRTVTISMPHLAERAKQAPVGGFRRALHELIESGVVLVVEQGAGQRPTTFAVQKDFTQWGRFSVAASRLASVWGERPESRDALLSVTPQGQGGEGVTPQGHDPTGSVRVTPQGQSDLPHRVIPTTPNANGDGDLEGRKDRKDRKDSTTHSTSPTRGEVDLRGEAFDRFAEEVGAEPAERLRAYVAERKGADAASAHVNAALVSLDGMHGSVLTSVQIGEAIGDYVANGVEPNMALWRSYLRRAGEAATTGAARPASGAAPRNQAAPAKSYDYANPTNSEDEIKWQD